MATYRTLIEVRPPPGPPFESNLEREADKEQISANVRAIRFVLEFCPFGGWTMQALTAMHANDSCRQIGRTDGRADGRN